MRLVISVMAICVVAMAVWVLRNFEPGVASWYPKCAFHQATGLHCPGCGATRALRALVLGDVLLAIRYNPMLILGLPVIFGMIAWQRRRERAGGLASPKMAWVLFLLLLVYMIGRNLPSPLLSPLAPPASLRSNSVDGGAAVSAR